MLFGRVRQLINVLAFGILIGVAGGCDETPTQPSDRPFDVVDIRPGTGAIALSGDLLSVHYIGWLFDPLRIEQKGGVFDTSRNGPPFAFRLGAEEVIPGWDVGLVGMSVGGIRRLVIPPRLAYGAPRNGPLPPYANLIFEIELLAIGDDLSTE